MSDAIKKIVEDKNELNDNPTGRADKVVVYKDRANIYRVNTFEITKGRNSIVFENLTSLLDEDSLKAVLSDDLKTKIRIKGINTKNKYIAYTPRKEEQELYNEIINLIREYIKECDQYYVLKVLEDIVEQFYAYTKDATSEIVMDKELIMDKLTNTLNFISEKKKSINHNIYDINIRRIDLLEEINKLKEKLDKIRTPSTRSLKNIYIELESDEDLSGDITLSYVVNNASWSTDYDVRLIEDNGEYSVLMTYYGKIKQNTGEDWKDAEILLTTANPRAAQMPDIYPIYFTGYERKVDTKQLVAQKHEIEDSFYGEEEEAYDGEYEAGAEAPEEAPSPEDMPELEDLPSPESVYSDVKDKTTSKIFKIEGRNTVLSDGETYGMTIYENNFNVELSYETIPKIVEYVYLKAKITNDTEYPLLKGKVNLFRKSGFVGNSNIEYIAPHETFYLSFGIDEDIKVRRITAEDDLIQDKPGFKQYRKFGYDISIVSYKDSTETIKLKENIPVSELKDVKVKIKDKTTEDYTHNKKEGILEWNITLSKGERRLIRLFYEVEAPKSYDLYYI